MNDLLLLFLGVVAAAAGGELFVRGAVGLAALSRVSPAIVGVTVAAFATSSPELSVGIMSARAGNPEISLGDVLGSNVVNIALVLGLALLVQPMRVPAGAIRRDLPLALLLPVILCLLGLDGRLDRMDSAVLALVFAGWLAMVVREAMQHRAPEDDVLGEHRWTLAIASSVAGLLLLVGAGHLIVEGARGIAHLLGLGEFVIGATLVAIGTSTPELATTLVARLRGHDEIGLGALLGSNIFNSLFIVATAAAITPIQFALHALVLTLAAGVVAVVLARPDGSGLLSRARGLWLLTLYVGYTAAVLTT